MNVLDENVPDDQWRLLQRMRVRIRKIGRDLGQKGMDDDQIISLLHHLNRATLFTLDEDFYESRLCHEAYCLVYLDVDEAKAGDYVRRILRHPAMNSKAKRMGRVVRVRHEQIRAWAIHEKNELRFDWPQ